LDTNRIVAVTDCVTIKRLETNGGVPKASGKTEERTVTEDGVDVR
jgi:hypothetical protein